RRRHTRSLRDWSSDVCSSDLLKNRPAMRLILGYTFHSWELLGMWAWTPAFVAAVFAATGAGTIRAVELAAYLSAAFHLTGLVARSEERRVGKEGRSRWGA